MTAWSVDEEIRGMAKTDGEPCGFSVMLLLCKNNRFLVILGAHLDWRRRHFLSILYLFILAFFKGYEPGKRQEARKQFKNFTLVLLIA